MAKIIVNEGETIDSAIRRWKKRVLMDGDMLVLREKEYYVSKGEKRRQKRKEGIRNQRINTKKYDY